MKQLSGKILIACGTLLIGIVASVWFTGYFKQPEQDLNIYPVDFCVLAENQNNYDGKFIRIKGIYGGLGTDTPTFLTAPGCQQRIYDTCKMDTNSCVQMYSQLRSKYAPMNRAIAMHVEYIGRFRVNVDNPLKTDRLYTESVNLVEVTELIGIETIKNPSSP